MAFELVDIRGNGAQLIRKSCSQPALFDLGQGQDDLATGRRFGFQTGHQADPSTSYPSSQGSRSRPPGPLAAWFASWRRKPKHQPAAHSLAQREEAYDVYVAARPFESFGGDLFQRLPAPVHDLLLDVGVCHFMAIFKDRSSGRMLQFDFGPVGGDIAIDGPLGDVLKEDRQHSKRKNMQTSSSALTLIRQETGSLGLPDANQARG